MNKKPWLDKHRIELVVGVFVAAGFFALLLLSIKVSNLSSFGNGDTYTLTALFDNVGGLKVKSSVSAGGVRIGRVTAIEYDQRYYQSVVTMEIEARYNQLPDDTSASIYTAGLLGENYIGLEPGGSNAWLKDGSEIDLTQSAVVLEQILGQFMYNKASESNGGASHPTPSAPQVKQDAGGFFGGQPTQALPTQVPPNQAPPGPYRSSSHDYASPQSRDAGIQGDRLGDGQNGMQGHRWGGVPPEGLTGPESPVAASAATTSTNQDKGGPMAPNGSKSSSVHPAKNKDQP